MRILVLLNPQCPLRQFWSHRLPEKSWESTCSGAIDDSLQSEAVSLCECL
jgi:hypothetical protein